jgi:hypothetical protein
MADSIDWGDETLRPLDELARLAFPDGGVTAKTLNLRARRAPKHRMEMQERRRVRAGAKYREEKIELAKDSPE